MSNSLTSRLSVAAVALLCCACPLSTGTDGGGEHPQITAYVTHCAKRQEEFVRNHLGEHDWATSNLQRVGWLLIEHHRGDENALLRAGRLMDELEEELKSRLSGGRDV